MPGRLIAQCATWRNKAAMWSWSAAGGLLLAVLLAACLAPPAPAPPVVAAERELPRELIFYDWADNVPQSIFDAFEAETGVHVVLRTFGSLEEMTAEMRAGKQYDVVNVGSEVASTLIAEGRLAAIDYDHVPNFTNIALNFRDLSIDPGNKHLVPLAWGTTGLVVRTDLTAAPVTRWADLWDARYAGKVVWWEQPRFSIAIALKTLGFSANSEEPAELEAALEQLLKLAGQATLEPYDIDAATTMRNNGQAVLSWGWQIDALAASETNPAVAYVLPEEGALLWGDNLGIPANSPNHDVAELFINFMLRPEIHAEYANTAYMAIPNDAALPLIKPEIVNNRMIFPSDEDMRGAEIVLPLTAQGEKLYADIWARFLDTVQ